MQSQTTATRLYQCPSRESRRYCTRAQSSRSMAGCMQSLDLAALQKLQRKKAGEIDAVSVGEDSWNSVDENVNSLEKTFSFPQPKVKGEDAQEWRIRSISGTMRGGMFTGGSAYDTPAVAAPRVRSDAMEIRERLSSGFTLARCISQTNPPPSPFRQSKMISSDAEGAYKKNRIGVMNNLIGKCAESTTASCPSKYQVRSLASAEARDIRSNCMGTATRELMTNSNLEPPEYRACRSKQSEEASRDRRSSIQSVFGGYGITQLKSDWQSGPTRLTTVEAKDYAEKQREGSNMRDILSFGAN